MKNVAKFQTQVQCCICLKYFYIYNCRINKITGRHYCSKECRYDKKATQLRYSHYKKTMHERYGYENSFQKPGVAKIIFEKRNEKEIMIKKEKTFLKRYGVRNPQQVKQFREKTRQTSLERHGSSCAMNGVKQRVEIKERMIEKYGVDHVFKSKEFKEMMQGKFEKKYGDKFYFAIGHEGFAKSLKDIYGVENCMFVPEIAEKASMGFGKFKNTNKLYTLPSGKIIRLQGFEDRTIERLLKIYNEEEISYKKSDVPEIYYIYKGKKKRYYSDFFVAKHNNVIETKSVFTLFGDAKDKKDFFMINLAKFEATLSLNYLLEIDIVIPYKEIICTIQLKKVEDLIILQDKTLRLLK